MDTPETDSKRNAPPWLPWYSSKWLSSPTRFEMNLAERAIYLDLLFICYERLGRIPADPSKLARLALATPEEFAAAWPTVGAHFVPCEDDPTMLTNDIVAETMERHWKIHEARSAAGHRGGVASGIARNRSKNEAHDEAKTKQMTTQIGKEITDEGNEQESGFGLAPPDQAQQTPQSPRPADGLTAEQESWFAEFWAAYWLHKARKPAKRAFAKQVRDEAKFTLIMAGVAKQTAEMMSREPSKRPHAATWLNAERWDDEADTAPGRSAITEALAKWRQQ